MSRETINNRYLVERRLGSGSAAEVLLAADTILHRQVAIKRLHGWLSADREARTRFQQEAQAFARLAHPHIVGLFDVGEENGRPYLVMEYLEGETLRQIIDHEGPFHPDDVAVVLEHIGEALDYAHKRGVVHRDIKPENILVDRHGVVKVVDFGIAKVLEDATITQAGLAPGTARYISPEQAQGQPVTAASDIYSLGVIAYEMLAGRPPFSGDSAVAVATQHVNEQPVSPSAINPLTPPGASAVVLKALAKNPAERYSSAGLFAQAMADWRHAPAPAMPGHPAEDQRTVPIPTQAVAAGRPAEAPAPQAPLIIRRRNWRRPIALGSILLVALTTAGLLSWLLGDASPGGTPDPTPTARNISMPTAAPQPTNTAVPQQAVAPGLIGQRLDQVQPIDGVSITVRERRADPAYPVDTIIDQVPAPGEPLTADTIEVVLSTGPEPISLADLNVPGADLQATIDELVARGFDVQQQQVGSAEVPEGQLVEISPVEGVPGEEPITVSVSMGDKVLIPAELQGRPLDEVTGELESLGFVVDGSLGVSAQRIRDAGIPDLEAAGIEDQDVVGIQQSGIAFGQWVDSGATVTLVIYDASLDG